MHSGTFDHLPWYLLRKLVRYNFPSSISLLADSPPISQTGQGFSDAQSKPYLTVSENLSIVKQRKKRYGPHTLEPSFGQLFPKFEVGTSLQNRADPTRGRVSSSEPRAGQTQLRHCRRKSMCRNPQQRDSVISVRSGTYRPSRTGFLL